MARRRGVRKRLPRRRLKRDMTRGQILRPRRTPPEMVQAPKNQLTVTFRYTGEEASITKTINIETIRAFAVGQLGIAKDTKLVFQFLSVSVWEMAGNQILLGALDLLEPGTEELQVIEDQPGRNQWATVGYRWPRSHQQVVFHSDDDKSRNIFYLAGPAEKVNYNIFVRLRLLWRGAQRIDPRLSLVRQHLAQEAMIQ